MPLSILIYHRVLPEPDSLFPDEVDAKTFDRQMAFISSAFQIMPLLDAIRALRQGKLPVRAACITFDDGYADNAEVALPILKRHNIPATFFVATGFLNGGRMWNDTVIELVRRAPGDTLDLSELGFGIFNIGGNEQRRRTIDDLLGALKYIPLESRKLHVDRICASVPASLPSDLMMTSDQLRGLHNAGMEIGGHTVSHPILARMENTAARTEIAEGKATLENIIRAPVKLFAYPNGKPEQDYLHDHVEMVKELGFEGAVSTARGVARGISDMYQLPRFTPWDRSRIKFLARMAQNMMRHTDGAARVSAKAA